MNPFALVRAAAQRLNHGRIVSGGSTLSMQVARILEPMPHTIPGKLRQMARALQHKGQHNLAIALKNEGRFQAAIEVLYTAEPLTRDKRSIFALNALRGYLRVKTGAWSAAVAGCLILMVG